MPKNYDHRRSNRDSHGRKGGRFSSAPPMGPPSGGLHASSSDHLPQKRSRSRSRSPAPQDERARREAERRAQMEKLRAENEEEEKRLSALDQHVEQKPEEAEAKPQEEIIEVNEAELEGMDEEEQMRKLLGIEGFGSTKGQKVETNHTTSAAGAAAKHKARKFRQYMNRKGGFNRPLDKMD